MLTLLPLAGETPLKTGTCSPFYCLDAHTLLGALTYLISLKSYEEDPFVIAFCGRSPGSHSSYEVEPGLDPAQPLAHLGHH